LRTTADPGYIQAEKGTHLPRNEGPFFDRLLRLEALRHFSGGSGKKIGKKGQGASKFSPFKKIGIEGRKAKRREEKSTRGHPSDSGGRFGLTIFEDSNSSLPRRMKGRKRVAFEGEGKGYLPSHLWKGEFSTGRSEKYQAVPYLLGHLAQKKKKRGKQIDNRFLLGSRLRGVSPRIRARADEKDVKGL